MSVSVSFVPLNFPYRLNASHMTSRGCCSAVNVVELSTVRLTLNPIVIFGLISMYTLEKRCICKVYCYLFSRLDNKVGVKVLKKARAAASTIKLTLHSLFTTLSYYGTQRQPNIKQCSKQTKKLYKTVSRLIANIQCNTPTIRQHSVSSRKVNTYCPVRFIFPCT